MQLLDSNAVDAKQVSPTQMKIELNTPRPWATRKRDRQEGMTLVEIMIVVIIMALMATAVGVAVLPQLESARRSSSRTDASALQGAVTIYIAQNARAGCPTVEDLIESGLLDRSKRTTDAWDNDFRIECNGLNVEVVSNGPDGVPSEDDVYGSERGEEG
ncbi:MAG: type II secretion system protein [Myxococcota bacterium]